MTLARTEILDLVGAMPEQLDPEELIDRLYLRVKLAKAEADVAAGRTLSAQEARHVIATWRK